LGGNFSRGTVASVRDAQVVLGSGGLECKSGLTNANATKAGVSQIAVCAQTKPSQPQSACTQLKVPCTD